MHDSALGGHSGINGTLHRLKMLFYWPIVKEEPLPILEQAWSCISMDFIEGLPQSYGKDSILVVIDRLRKYSHFIPLKHLYTAVSIAKVFFDNIYKLHGLPVSIVSDRDRIFTSNFWKELFSFTGVSLYMSSAYHHKRMVKQRGSTNALKTTSGLKATPFQALYSYLPNQLAIGPYLQCHH
ncbi:hypothetical protein Sango_1606000 [Sesamum angolense]|uniref:Integrase catalytic domain-containing protein n=1 Tax=Sesamum angolense TaxID=2727404 RepID=A0AAE2BQW5_9LAMI|nr:hypothetical protein Sango_1606000 [Sesamum angolense]